MNDQDIVVRTVNGGVHRLATRSSIPEFFERLDGQVRSTGHISQVFMETVDGRWIGAAHVVEVWQVPAGGSIYEGLA